VEYFEIEEKGAYGVNMVAANGLLGARGASGSDPSDRVAVDADHTEDSSSGVQQTQDGSENRWIRSGLGSWSVILRFLVYRFGFTL